MKTIISDVLIPVITTAGFSLSALALKEPTTQMTKNMPKTAQRLAKKLPGLKGKGLYCALVWIYTLALAAAFLLLDGMVSALTVPLEGSRYMSGAALFTAALSVNISLYFALWSKSERVNKLLKYCSLICLVLLAAECFVFSGRALTLDKKVQDDISFTFTENVQNPSDSKDISFGSGTSGALEFVPDEGIRSINFVVDKPLKDKMIKVTSYIKDDNFSLSWQQTDSKYVSANGEGFSLDIDPYGEVRGVRIFFENLPGGTVVKNISASSARPFVFSTARYIILALILCFLAAVKILRLSEVSYDPRSVAHKAVIAVIIAVCTFSPLFLSVKSENIKYDKTKDYSSYDIFTETFDALANGQASLRRETNEGLNKLEEKNQLYDNSVRGQSGIAYAWDHAYKDGKYYSYFGITPLITLYFPMYYMSGEIPSLNYAIMFYSVWGALFSCLALFYGARLLCGKINMLLLCLLLPAVVAAEGFLYCLQYSGMYVLPVASGICFLMLTLFLGFAACRREKGALMYAELALSGLSLGLCAGARPTLAVSAAVLIPLFLGILLNKKNNIKQKVFKATAFTLPMLAVICGLLCYNRARFGSLTDFGAQYQLTVSNINANVMRLYALPDAVYHYILQPPVISGAFPFVSMNGAPLASYERYRFIYQNMGIIWIPLVFMGFLLLKSSLSKKYYEGLNCGVTLLQKRAVIVTGFAVAVIVAWMNFCMAGCGMQYIFDIAPILCLCSAAVLLTVCRDGGKYKCALAACVISVFIVFIFLAGTMGGQYTKIIRSYMKIRKVCLCFGIKPR